VSGAAHAAADRQDTERALRDIAERLNALDVWFSEAEQQRVRWLAEVKAKDREVEEVSGAVDRARGALAQALAALTELQAERRALEARRLEQAERIGDHLAAAYRMTGQDFVKLLLNQESPDRLDRMVRYHSHFSAARLEAIEAYQATLDELAANQRALDARVADQRQRQETLERQQAELIREREQRKRLLAELDEEVESRSDERARLEADRDRLESLLAELRSRAQELDGRQFAARKGALPWPVTGPVRAAFGQPRADGRLVWHGMVINADAGTPITAVFQGRVVFADWLRGFGLLLIIDHGSGYMTLYGHADALLKRSGDWVESGEVIARAGRSGGQSRSGLYFEVRQQGTARDPISWLTQR